MKKAFCDLCENAALSSQSTQDYFKFTSHRYFQREEDCSLGYTVTLQISVMSDRKTIAPDFCLDCLSIFVAGLLDEIESRRQKNSL